MQLLPPPSAASEKREQSTTTSNVVASEKSEQSPESSNVVASENLEQSTTTSNVVASEKSEQSPKTSNVGWDTGVQIIDGFPMMKINNVLQKGTIADHPSPDGLAVAQFAGGIEIEIPGMVFTKPETPTNEQAGRAEHSRET